jgi:hypothetical protein
MSCGKHQCLFESVYPSCRVCQCIADSLKVIEAHPVASCIKSAAFRSGVVWIYQYGRGNIAESTPSVVFPADSGMSWEGRREIGTNFTNMKALLPPTITCCRPSEMECSETYANVTHSTFHAWIHFMLALIIDSPSQRSEESLLMKPPRISLPSECPAGFATGLRTRCGQQSPSTVYQYCCKHELCAPRIRECARKAGGKFTPTLPIQIWPGTLQQ